jgi:HD-GYP domain-containing protein (c-di-GMP phosphodiesterase class II)
MSIIKEEAEEFERVGVGLRLDDPYIWFHGSKTAAIVYKILEHLKMPDDEARWTLEAALLHDIGITNLGWDIRSRWPIKPGTWLEEEEWDDILAHPRLGYREINRKEYLGNILPGILYHHERWDGYGYPEALKGEEIPLSARVIAVADYMDSLAAPRGTKIIMPVEIALKKIKKEEGGYFEPAVVTALMQVNERELMDILTRDITDSVDERELKWYKKKMKMSM